MARARVRLNAGESPPVPEWWAFEFSKRQNQLKTLILRYLARAGRALSHGELTQCGTGYWASEHRHARQTLIEEGLLTSCTVQERRQRGRFPESYTIETFTYYDLANRSPSTKKS